MNMHSAIGSVLVIAALLPATTARAADTVGTRDFSEFRMVIDRNIFDPNRRPRVTKAPPPKVVDSFTLAGTLAYAKGEFAVFDGNGSEYHKVLEAGGSIAGYTLESIEGDRVKLASGTNVVELRVGMQMRRNDAGTWAPSAMTDNSLASYAPSISGAVHVPAPTAADGDEAAPPPEPGAPPPLDPQNPGQPPGFEPGAEAGSAPAEPPGGNDNEDPVARMMRVRREQMNQTDNRN
jgi:hypothetical protein